MFKRKIRDDPRKRPRNPPLDRPYGFFTQNTTFEMIPMNKPYTPETFDSSSSSTTRSYARARARGGFIHKLNFLRWYRYRKKVQERARRKQIKELTRPRKVLNPKKPVVTEPMFLRVNTVASIKDQEILYVKAYLEHNENILEQVVMETIPIETVKKWVMKKGKVLSQFYNVRNNYGVANTLFYYKDLRRSFTMDQFDEDDRPYKLAGHISAALHSEGFRVFKLYAGSKNVIDIFEQQSEDGGFGCRVVKLALVRSEDAELTKNILEIAAMGGCVKVTKFEDYDRFPQIPYAIFDRLEEELIELLNYVLYVPFVNEFGKAIYLVEIWSMQPFCKSVVEIATVFSVWSALCLNYDCTHRIHIEESKKEVFADSLITLVPKFFSRTMTMELLTQRIIEYAQYIVHADRASFFLVDDKRQELVSMYFDLHLGETRQHQEFRIPLDKGVVGLIVKTKETVNIPDVSSDDRFYSSVDDTTHYKTSSILGTPIIVDNKVVGVLEFINKEGSPNFRHKDEVSVKLFAQFLKIALKQSKIIKDIPLDLHINRCDDDLMRILLHKTWPKEINLVDFYLDPFNMPLMDKCKNIITMYTFLFNIPEDKTYEIKGLARFILTVMKNYRSVAYHDFCHGWAVTQSLFTLLNKDRKRRFNNKEATMFMAALCHDMDHPGFNNKFPEVLSPTAAMYSTSMTGNRPYNLTLRILQQEDHNFLGFLTSKEYKELLQKMGECMLATDLTQHLSNIDRIKRLLVSDVGDIQFRWQNSEHKDLAISIAMTAVDLSATAKPWDIHLKAANKIIEEIYDHGDKEKDPGIMAMIPDEHPECHIEFLTKISIPCYELLQKILPHSKPLLHMSKNNKLRWQARADRVTADRRRALVRCIPKSDKDSDDDTSDADSASSDIVADLAKSVRIAENEPQPLPSGLQHNPTTDSVLKDEKVITKREHGSVVSIAKYEPQPGPSGLQHKPTTDSDLKDEKVMTKREHGSVRITEDEPQPGPSGLQHKPTKDLILKNEQLMTQREQPGRKKKLERVSKVEYWESAFVCGEKEEEELMVLQAKLMSLRLDTVSPERQWHSETYL